MSETVAAWLLAAVGVYAVGGLVFAIVFVLRGVARIDPQAVGGSWGFRLAILPGVVALWPLLIPVAAYILQRLFKGNIIAATSTACAAANCLA